MKVGCVLFDDPADHADGWAAVANEAPIRLGAKGIGRLASDVCHITNLDYELSWRSGMANHSRFRRSDYLQERVDRICARLGITSIPEQATVIAQLFASVSNLANRFMYVDLPKHTLRHGIHETHGCHDEVMDERLCKSLQDATCYYVSCLTSYADDEQEAKTFHLSSPSLLAGLLKFPRPGSHWRHLTAKDMPKEVSVEALLGLGKLFIAKIKAYDFSPEFSDLLNFGVNPSTKLANRQWVTSLEVIQLATMAKTKILEAYVCDDPQPFTICETLPTLEQLLQPENQLSISIQLLCTSIWTSLGAAFPPPIRRRTQVKPGQGWCNPATPFVRAFDRLTAFRSAAVLEQHGMQIQGYGAGVVRAKTGSMSDNEIAAAACAAGVIPPLLNSDSFPDSSAHGDDQYLAAMQALFSLGMKDKIFQSDQAIVQGLTHGN